MRIDPALLQTLLGLTLLLGLCGCGPEAAGSPPERRLLTGLAAEDWPVALAGNRVVHPRFVPASRTVDWMAWSSYDLAGNKGTPERLFLPGLPFAGPTLEARGPRSGDPFWVSGLAAGGRAPLRVSVWLGLPEGETLDADHRVEVHGYDPTTGADRVDRLEAAGDPQTTVDGYAWTRLAGTLSGDRLGQLELRALTVGSRLRLGQPVVLAAPLRSALIRTPPPVTASRAATALDRRRARLRQASARQRPPPQKVPADPDGALRRRRALRTMTRTYPPSR